MTKHISTCNSGRVEGVGRRNHGLLHGETTTTINRRHRRRASIDHGADNNADNTATPAPIKHRSGPTGPRSGRRRFVPVPNDAATVSARAHLPSLSRLPTPVIRPFVAPQVVWRVPIDEQTDERTNALGPSCHLLERRERSGSRAGHRRNRSKDAAINGHRTLSA